MRQIWPEDPVLRALQDGARAGLDDVDFALLRRLGDITPTKYKDYQAIWGQYVPVDPSGGAFTVRLPPAETKSRGLLCVVKNISASSNAISLVPSGSNTIDGQRVIHLSTPYAGAIVTCVGDGRLACIKTVGAVSANENEPWWVWNGVDTSQFGAVSAGSQVASSALTVSSYSGVNWLDVTVTSTASAGNSAKTTAMWAILDQAPTQNNKIEAEWITKNKAGGTNYFVGAQLSPMFTAPHDAYTIRVAWTGTRMNWTIQRHSGGVGTEASAQLGDQLTDPEQIATNNGNVMAASILGDAVLKLITGETMVVTDPGGGPSLTGRPALGGCVSNINSDTVQIYYRNIKIFTVTE